ncbi:MAG TPA: S8 family serine peptidase, partial [Usitatibacter sp.]|nr:S8 family serine peptidase [Usitatibacter sp.]
MSDKHMRTLTIGLFGRLAAAIVSLTMAATGAFAQGNSQVAHARHMKVSDDLASVLDHGNTNHVRWVQKGANGDLVRVIIAVDPTGDKTLKALRKAVLDAGGSVHRHLQSLDQVVAMLPASMVDAIAARNDVVKVAPNRSLAATASLTEKVVGASDVRSLGTSGTTLDGRGVGIAFLDSGIMSSHGAFAGSSGTSRVTARVDLVPPPTTSTFTSGVDSTLNLVTTGSTAPAKDPFGHGTLAASVAAGKGVYSLLTESGGIAPGATLVDVRVLDDKGVGDLGTALAGIDWILAHAKENNIRVLNISLGTDSTDSYLDDPFCKAVRAVVASGVTVVVAA